MRNDDLERGRSLAPAVATVLVTALVVLASVGSGAVGAPRPVERPGTTPGSAASPGIDAGNGGPVDAGRDGTSGPASEAVTVRSATETARPATETAAVAPAGFIPGDPSPANLLANPGCEAAGETGAPDGWTDQSPNGRSVYCTYVDGADDDGSDLTTQRAPEGPLAIADGRPDGETKVLVQTVPVTAGRAYEVAGWVGTDDALSSADYGEVEVRYLDGSGAPIGTAVTRSSLRSDTDDAFDRFSAVSTAPSGAASAQVRLELVNADATGHAAVFVDGLTVRRTGPGPTASDDLLSVAAGGSLSPAATLFADSGHGTDRRGGSAATVASFGGGDLGGSVADNAPGTTVPLAGGDLTVTADGTVSLAGPTTPGTYGFRYRLSNGTASDEATVEVRVLDGSPNLLSVPGCEVQTPGERVVGWTDVSAGGPAAGCPDLAGTSFTTQQQPTGAAALGDVRGTAAGGDVTVRQTVPVTAGETYRIAGRVGTDDALSTTDAARVRVDYLDGSGAVLAGGQVDLPGLRSDTDDAFDGFSGTGTAPSGAVEARVTVTLANVDGTGHADAFVDDLSLRRVDPGVRARDDGPFVTPAGRTLAPATTLLEDTGVGADGLGSPAATVASFGGGDLGGTVTGNPAGSTVPLAGGTLTVTADGSLVLREPVVTGTYAFRYRLSNGAGSDDATVRIRVANVSRNLLGNAGCELHGRADRPVGWTDESGTRSVACLDLRGGSFTAQDQPAGAYAIGDRDADGANESIVRTVRVSPGRTYVLSGHVGTDSSLSSTDGARVELRFLDGAGSVIAGEGVALAGLRSATDESHSPFEGSATAPPGAERARVRVVLVDGDGGHADAFVDDLSLAAAPVLPDARDDGPFGVDVGGSLAPTASLLADNGNGSDDLGIPTGTVVGFGGGDLGGTVTDNAPGSTVPLAGGDLTVTADGSLSLAAPTEGGTYAFDYRLASSAGSDDARAFVAVRAPEITVVGNGSEVASGDATPSRADGTDFGAVPVEGGTATATFEVRNDGLRALVLDGRTPVNVTGPNAGEFAVTAQPATTVPAGGSTTVAVAFDPTGVDERTATLSIRSTDASEDPYAVAVAGVGTDELTATTGAATDVTPTAATLPGVVDPGGRTTTVAVDYWPTGSPGAATTITANESPVAGVTDLSVSARATGLTPATNYTYRVVATNPNGTATGANRTVETPVAPPTATTLAATGATTSAATLRGTVTPGGGATTVAFRYYPVGRPAAATTVPANRTPVGGTTTLAVNATVGGLSPETTYAYRVTAANAAGTDEGAILTTTTRSEPPVLVATGPFAADETAPTGTVVGDVDATDGEGGAVDDNVTYTLAGGSPDLDPDGDGTPAFAIDADDGRLRVADADDLDHEANASSALEVRVDDDAGRTTNATVTVTVRDVAPTLATQSLGTVGDAAPAGTVVGNVDAGGDDTSVSYRIADGNPAVDGDGTPAFSIDAATGEVSVADPDDLDAGTATAVDLAVEVTDGTTPASATVSLSVTDTTAPTADAGGNRTVEVGQSTVLDATGSTDNVGIAAFEWDVGDDGTVDATGSTVNYTFGAVGPTVVALTVTDAAGNAATDTATVTVEDTTPPNVPAVPNRTVDEDVPVAFDASGTTDEGTVASYEWAFGDGSANATGTNVSYTYAQPGTYVVVLTVTDGAGNVARASGTVVVRDVTPPEARLVANRTSVLTGAAVRFDAGNSTDNVGIETYAWDVDGDGTTDATGPNATWTSATPGTYAVTLTARDAAGNADTATATVRVDAPGTLSVELLGTTAPVAAGEPLDATVRVENIGTRSATQDLTLAANGTTVATRSVTLAGGANRTLTLSWATRDGDGGSYALSVSSVNDTATTTVVVVPPNPFPDGLPGQRSVTPRNVDGDVRYEDVDGNGRIDVGDAITLLFADWATINGNPAQRAALDGDGDGRVGFLDVVELLFE